MSGEPLSIGEFTRTMSSLEKTISDRFDRVERKQDNQAAELSEIKSVLAQYGERLEMNEDRLDALDDFSTRTAVPHAHAQTHAQSGGEHISVSASKGMWAAVGAAIGGALALAAKAFGMFSAKH